jgi:hypothetical protein
MRSLVVALRVLGMFSIVFVTNQVANAQTPADGSVIRRSTGDVYLMEDGQRRGIRDMPSLRAYGLGRIMHMSDAQVDGIPLGLPLPSIQTRWIRRSTGEIYFLEAGKRRHIISMEVLAKLFPQADVRDLPDADVDSIAEGDVIGRPTFRGDVPCGPIVDEGYPALRKLADVNGDKRLDYCRFAGEAPDIFLSCQLAMAKDCYSKEPHGFNSIKGIDQGYENKPRALIDINADGKADFCRYVGNPPDVRLLCNLAGKSGFEAEQYTNPSNYLAAGDKRALLIAADGTPISYITNSTTGSWYAFGTDSNGTPWRLEGEIKKHADSHAGPGHFIYNADVRLYNDTVRRDRNGRPLPENQNPVRPGLRVRVSTSWNDAGSGMNFRITGLYGYRSVGFEYSQTAFSPSVGFLNVYLRRWRCEDTRKDVICDTRFAGELRSDAEAPNWKGKQPQSMADYLPDEIKLLSYFQPVLDIQTAETDASVETGVAWFDAKHWYEHRPADLIRLKSDTTFDQQVGKELGTIRRLEIFGNLMIAVGVIGLGIGFAPITVAAGAYIGLYGAVGAAGVSWWGIVAAENTPARLLERCKKYPNLEWCIPGKQGP